MKRGKRRLKGPRPKDARSIRFSITTTHRVYELLEALRDSGLYGTSVAEAAERLVCDGLLRKVKQTTKGK